MMPQLGIDGVVAVPAALHVTVVPMSEPIADPDTFKSPGQVALNEPLALVAVCSVGVHLKSVQLDAVGIMLASAVDCQLPIIDATVLAADGAVGTVVLFSNPTQPAAATHSASAQADNIILIKGVSVFLGETFGRWGPSLYPNGMSILKVARMGHPVLRARAQAIDPDDIKSPPIQQLIDDMFETMKEYHGIGLAAPQVHESVRIFVAGVAPRPGDSDNEEDDDARVPLMALINPEITAIGDETADDWEGCLSIPDIRGRVTRPREIEVKAYDRRGRRIAIHARGFTARVIQHENDHLDGVLFLDRMESFETLTFIEEFSRYWSHKDVPEE